jgi:hypothetical protein
MNADEQIAESPQDGLSRRQVLAAGASGLAVGATSGLLNPLGASAATEHIPPAINGKLKGVSGPDQIVLESFNLSLDWPYRDIEPSGSDVSITVTDSTQLYRDGSDKQLSDFQIGDSLIAFVDPVDGKLVASAVEPVYVHVRGEVTSRSDNTAVTADGIKILLSSTTLVMRLEGPTGFRALGDLSASEQGALMDKGERFGATCRVEPDSGDHIALQVVVE